MDVDNITVNARYIASITSEMTTDTGIMKWSINPDDATTDLLQLYMTVKANIFKECVSGAIDIVWPITTCALDT